MRQLKSKSLKEETQFKEAQAFYETNRRRLVAEYKGKFIAILNGRVIDADTDFSHLAERVFRREGCRDIFMPKVAEGPEVVNIPSPQFRGQ